MAPTVLAPLATGDIPNTHRTYEQFENFLASFHESLKSAAHGTPDDQSDFEQARAILEGFANRHNIRPYAEAIKNPRKADCPWDRIRPFDSCFTTLLRTKNFEHEFGITEEWGHAQWQAHQLEQHIINIFHRHKVLEAEYRELSGRRIAVRIKRWNFTRANWTVKEVIETP